MVSSVGKFCAGPMGIVQNSSGATAPRPIGYKRRDTTVRLPRRLLGETAQIRRRLLANSRIIPKHSDSLIAIAVNHGSDPTGIVSVIQHRNPSVLPEKPAAQSATMVLFSNHRGKLLKAGSVFPSQQIVTVLLGICVVSGIGPVKLCPVLLGIFQPPFFVSFSMLPICYRMSFAILTGVCCDLCAMIYLPFPARLPSAFLGLLR
jgi:hypothetical protein